MAKESSNLDVLREERKCTGYDMSESNWGIGDGGRHYS